MRKFTVSNHHHSKPLFSMSTPVQTATIALAQAIVHPGYGLRITALATADMPAGFYGAPEATNAGFVYSAWYTDCGDQVMVVVDGLGLFHAEYDRSVVPTLPA